MRYRQQSSYGTATGGLCSVFSWVIILFFSVSELYGLVVQPTYDQNKQIQFMPASNEKFYEIESD